MTLEFKFDSENSDKPKDEILTYRDLILAQLDGKTVQCFYGNSWIDYRTVVMIDVGSLDDVVDSNSYRIKPKIKRYCNGVELDDCITKLSDVKDKVYMPSPFSRDFYTVSGGSTVNQRLIKNGLVYNNAEAAAKHGKAMTIVEIKEKRDVEGIT